MTQISSIQYDNQRDRLEIQYHNDEMDSSQLTSRAQDIAVHSLPIWGIYVFNVGHNNHYLSCPLKNAIAHAFERMSFSEDFKPKDYREFLKNQFALARFSNQEKQISSVNSLIYSSLEHLKDLHILDFLRELSELKLKAGTCHTEREERYLHQLIQQSFIPQHKRKSSTSLNVKIQLGLQDCLNQLHQQAMDLDIVHQKHETQTLISEYISYSVIRSETSQCQLVCLIFEPDQHKPHAYQFNLNFSLDNIGVLNTHVYDLMPRDKNSVSSVTNQSLKTLYLKNPFL